MSVVGHKHSEVVEMIRDSSFVTLTLIGKLGSNGTAKGVFIDCVQKMYVAMCVYNYVYFLKNFCYVFSNRF